MPWPGRGPGNAPVGLWRTGCAGPPNGVRFGSHRGSLPPSGACLGPVTSPPHRHSSHTRLAHPAKPGCTACGEGCGEPAGAAPGQLFERTGQPSAEDRDDTTQWEKATPSWSRPTRTYRRLAGRPRQHPAQPAGLASACDPVTVHDELAIIAVPDEFTRTQVEGRLRAELEGALSEVFGRKIGLGTTINPALVAGSPEHEQRQAHADQRAQQDDEHDDRPATPPGGARQRERFID